MVMKIELPKWEFIPDIGLYLEQVNKFVNEYVPKNQGMELTPTMITNYVKLKIVPKGYKKTYSACQIAEFIIIAYLKTVISMDQIRLLFRHYDMNNKTKEFYNLFSSALAGKKTEDDIVNSLVSGISNKIELNEMIDKLDA